MTLAAWNIWMYRGETAKLFREGEEIPAGWHDAPSKFNGADPAKFDHDGDDRPGGSMPVKRGPGRPRKVIPNV